MPEVSSAIVLHEDKQYYANASDIYGPDVETVNYEQDTELLSQPIIAPVEKKQFKLEEEGLPEVFYNRQFQIELMEHPDHVRNVAIVGHLNHGKTSFVDMLVKQTHMVGSNHSNENERELLRYTDTSVLEKERGFTINSSPMSMLLSDLTGKHFLFNVLDTPGHVDFIDEVAVASRLADGFVVVVDVIEGLQVNTERIIKRAIADEVPFIILLNKMDRLILDLRLPPNEAYYKIVNVLDNINIFIKNNSPLVNRRVSPELGNVMFGSTKFGWCFTLKSFALFYQDLYPSLEAESFTLRLWGNIYYEEDTKKFTRESSRGERTFLHFILTPIYKLFSYTLTHEREKLEPFLRKLGIILKPSEYQLNVDPLLQIVFSRFFGDVSPFTSMVVDKIASPDKSSGRKLELAYNGSMVSPLITSANSCNPSGPLLVDAVKLYSSGDGKEFYVFGRIFSGTLRLGDSISVLGENFTAGDDEDVSKETVTGLWIYESRYKIPVEAVPAGQWALIGGVDQSINKCATLVGEEIKDDYEIFSPIKPISQSVVKIAVEPVNPSELPKMLDGLRSVTKTYALVTTKVEDSGEHIILGSGEVYMDCVMYDLRNVYTNVAIKVSDPSSGFCETCLDMSAIKFPTTSHNKKNKVTIVAEPLSRNIADDIESGRVDIDWPLKQISSHFQEQYEWDLMASRSIWAFGPGKNGPNILLDDTLPGEVDKKVLSSSREAFKQGFKWFVREGPLCEEPMRGVKFKVIDVDLAKLPLHRSAGQLIPTVRRACLSSVLLASPRLLEPVYSCRIMCSASSVPIIYDLLSRRRGNVLRDSAIPGTPLYSIEGTIPVIDSFGFEVDVRVATQGSSAVSLVFDSWELVPGDPLDKTQKTQPLQPASIQALARDFVLKTRKRKGLSDEPTITKFLDGEVVESLKESGLLEDLM